MIGELAFTLCVLGVVILGLLIMTRTITLEEMIGTIGSLFGLLVVALVALCLLRVLIAAVIVQWLISLKAAFLWTGIALVALIGLALIARIGISRMLNVSNDRETSNSRNHNWN